MQASPHDLGLQSLESIIDYSPLTVTPEIPILDAIALMANYGKGVLVKSASQVVGCLTQKDIVRLVASGSDLKTTKVAEVMQSLVMQIKTEAVKTLTAVASLLCGSESYLLSVVDEQEQIVGIISPESICLAVAQSPQKINGCQIVENQLWQSQQMLQLIMDTMPHSIFWKDINSRFLGCNRNFAQMVGFENPAEIVGKTDYDLVRNPEKAEFYRAYDAAVMQTNQAEYYVIKPQHQTDGSQIWLETNQVPLLDTEGQVVGMLGTIEDITKRMQVQEALEKSETRFRFLAESIPQQVWIANADGRLEYINQQTLNYFGCTPDRVLREQWQEWVHPDDLSASINSWYQSLTTGTNHEKEFRLWEKASGTYRWHLTRALPLRDRQGQIINWFGTNTDIHDRVAAEIALRESERKYQNMAKVSPVGLFRSDAEGDCLYVNERWCEMTGLTPEAAMGSGWVRAIHPEDREIINSEWYRSVQENSFFRAEYRFQLPDGRITWVFGQAVAEQIIDGEVITYVGTVTDITNLKQVESALAERVKLADFRSEVDTILTQSETLATMMLGCTDALVKHLDAAFARIWILNQEEQVLELQVSSGIYTHTNGSHSRVEIGRLKIGLIAAEGQPHFTNFVQDDLHLNDKEWAKREGMVAFAGYPLIVEGEIIGVIALFSRQPLTESTFSALGIAANEIAIGIKRKQTEAALRESEERFRNLVEASSDWVWEADENAVYTYVSPQIREILGYEPQKVLGKTPFELMPAEDAEYLMNICRQFAKQGQSFKCLENTYVHQDGHLVILEANGVPIVDVEGRFCGYRGMSRDITLRKQEADTLWETQQRLQAILDNLPAVMYLLDTENKYLLINKQFENISHLSQEQIIGKSIYDVWNEEIAAKFATHNLEVIAGGIPLETEEITPHKNGLHTYLSVKFPLKDVNGIAYAVCGISTDITDRKQAEQELRQNEEYLRLLVEGVKDYAIYMLDPEGRVMSWNSGAECITGYQASEIIGHDFCCFFPEEGILNNIPKQQLEIAAANGRCECESVFVRKDSSLFWANCILTPLHDDTGKLRGFSKVTRDITERKLAEKSLLRLQKAIESTSDAISITDIAGKAIYVNPAFIEIFDYTVVQLNTEGGLSANFRNKELFNRVFRTVQRGQSWRGEVTMKTRSGEDVQVDLRTDAIKDSSGEIVAFVSICTDITQRKLIEEGLRLRDRAMAASSNGIVIADVTNPDNLIIYVNAAFERMTGYSVAEVLGQNFPLLQSVDINQPALEELRTAMEAGKDCKVILRHYSLDHRLFWHELNISPVYDVYGYLTHYIGIQNDITERKQVETELLISQQRLQYLLTASPAVIYTRKPREDFGAIFISDNIQGMVGYEAQEFLEDASFWYSHIHPEDAPDVLTELSQVLKKKQYILEYRFLHQNGTYRWVYDQGKVVWDEAGNPLELVGYWADITSRKQLEQEIRVALEKEKELNELKSRFISMTSHEFRTPLSTILSSSELLEHYRYRWTQEKQLTHLHRIQTAVHRMTEMLDDILVSGKAEAGKLEYRPLLFDLVKYCRQLVEDFRLNLRTQHFISFSSEYESISCYTDEKLLGHILSNLLSNAIKYSDNSSLITLKLACEDEKVVLEIQDQGIGIPEEDLPHLFESFHRARNVGNILGTGLGLAIVKKCVDICQGAISVNSQIGTGTKFTVKLPLKKYTT
ncbi:MAG: PAS domain S-box protein [Nostocales cyanobacterium]|nr:MAG: PAS domain S-box protein [Nostocales cyanobacterium]